MSLHGYHYSVKLSELDAPFEALIMAAMRKADSRNTDLLEQAFPEIRAELWARYCAPLGIIPEDGVVDQEAVLLQISNFRSQPL